MPDQEEGASSLSASPSSASRHFKPSANLGSLISRSSTPEPSLSRPTNLLTKSLTTAAATSSINISASSASAMGSSTPQLERPAGLPRSQSLFGEYAPMAMEQDRVERATAGDALGFIRFVSHRAEISGTSSLRGRPPSLHDREDKGKERALDNEAEQPGLQQSLASLGVGDAEEEDYPRRRYYILSSAGKPVYISHLATSRVRRRRSSPTAADEAEERAKRQAQEDEEDEEATTQVGVMQALISIFADEEGDKLRHITNGRTRITFLLRSPLYLVCVSGWGEPPETLRNHLENLHLQVLSMVSAGQLHRLFERMPNFDLRRMMEGTEGLLGAMLDRLQTDMSFPLEALQPVRLEQSLRESVAAALVPPKGEGRPKDLLYVLLLANEQVVTLLRPRKHSVHPSDMHLLINTVYGAESFREPGGESWIPLCLPKFAPQGFVHAYVSFLENPDKADEDQDGEEDNSVALVVVTGNRDGFSEISAWRTKIMEALAKKTLLSKLFAALPSSKYSVDELRIAGLRHFIYKSRPQVQLTSPRLHETSNKPRLITLYNLAHASLHHPATTAGPTKMQYYQTEHEAVLAWITQPFELYLAFNPAISKTAIVAAANGVAKWVKTNEQSVFILNGISF